MARFVQQDTLWRLRTFRTRETCLAPLFQSRNGERVQVHILQLRVPLWSLYPGQLDRNTHRPYRVTECRSRYCTFRREPQGQQDEHFRSGIS